MKAVTVASASLIALATLYAGSAVAAPTGTVVFTTPTGAVDGNVDIPVYFTVALSGDSEAITTDAQGRVTSGVDNADLIAAGIDPALVARSNINVSFSCSGTFTTGCDGPPYHFDFAFGDDALTAPLNLDLEAGSTTIFQFGTFQPTGGSAPTGHYTFYDAAIFAQYYDADNNHLGDVQFFHTCQNGDTSCAFTRDVTGVTGTPGAVPEPASWALMLGGFGMVGGAMRSRRKALVRFS
jgi:hypothetical protein